MNIQYLNKTKRFDFNKIVKSFFMPELPECRIMSDFINRSSKNRHFNKIYKVEKGNIPNLYLESNFNITSTSSGKELSLELEFKENKVIVYCFMGMTGNWSLVNTNEWSNTKYIRLRFDSTDGKSLILHGGYMGPKFKIDEKFTGTKRGPDPLRNFEDFKLNVLNNLDDKSLNKPLGESLLNQKYFNGVGAYLASEILGRLDINPFLNLKSLSDKQLEQLFHLIYECCSTSYKIGGGEIRDWYNPFGKSEIEDWIQFYNKKDICYKQKFGTRNIWIKHKFRKKSPNCCISDGLESGIVENFNPEKHLKKMKSKVQL